MPEEEETLYWTLSELSVRLTDLEEHVRLLKDRLLTVSRTLLEQTERIDKELAKMKDELKRITAQTAEMKEAVDSIVAESTQFVRKEELVSLTRYVKMFEPLKYVTEEDVKRIIASEQKKAKL